MMPEYVREMRFQIVVDTNKRTEEREGDSWDGLVAAIQELRDAGFAPESFAPPAEAREDVDWTPDKPLRADASRQDVLDRFTYLNNHAADLAEAVGPWYVAALVVEMQNACRAPVPQGGQGVEEARENVASQLRATGRDFDGLDALIAAVQRETLAKVRAKIEALSHIAFESSAADYYRIADVLAALGEMEEET